MDARTSALDEIRVTADASAHRTRGRLIGAVLASQLGRLLVIYGVLFLALAISAPDFATRENFTNIGSDVAIYGLASLGITVAMIAGAVDVSFAAVMSLCGIVAAECLQAGDADWVSILIALGVGAGLGGVNGALVWALNIDALVVTLGTFSIFGGWAYYHTDGSELQVSSHLLAQVGNGTAAGVPISVWVLLVAALLLGGLLRFTTFGQQLYAAGDNTRAAALAGLRVNWLRCAALMISGMAAAAAGVVMIGSAGQVFAGDGQNYLLPGIAAVVLGGTALSGGAGTIAGTLIGLLLLGTINSGLDLLQVNTNWQEVVSGAIVVAALILDRLRRNVA